MKFLEITNNRTVIALITPILLYLGAVMGPFFESKQPAQTSYIDIDSSDAYPLALDKLVRGKDLSIEIAGKKYAAAVQKTWNIYNYSSQPLDGAKFELEVSTEYKSGIYITNVSVNGQEGETRFDLAPRNLVPLPFRGGSVIYEIDVGVLNALPSRAATIQVGFLLESAAYPSKNDVKPVKLRLAQKAGWMDRTWNAANSDRRSSVSKLWQKYSEIVVFILVLIVYVSGVYLILKPIRRWETERWGSRVREIFSKSSGERENNSLLTPEAVIAITKLALTYRTKISQEAAAEIFKALPEIEKLTDPLSQKVSI